jgi:hypothetical protein
MAFQQIYAFHELAVIRIGIMLFSRAAHIGNGFIACTYLVYAKFAKQAKKIFVDQCEIGLNGVLYSFLCISAIFFL